MIQSVSDLLTAFIDAERSVLNKHKITHGPTIGKMYEGLASDALQRSVPNIPGLRVVTGFISGSNQKLSDEQDVMLVFGDGEQIPHTESHIYPVENVLVAIEVKKRLDKASLIDGIENLYTTYGLTPSKDLNVAENIRHSFRLITGHHPPDIDEIDKLDPLHRHVWSGLLGRRCSPARILLGYNGYRTEAGLRRGLELNLESIVEAKERFGPTHFPDVILGEGASLVSNNASPWTIRIEDNKWPLVISNGSTHPAYIFLETIWTRLHVQGFVDSSVFGMDLSIERWNKFITGELVPDGSGWKLYLTNLHAEDKSNSSEDSWSPVFLSQEAYVLANMLCQYDFIELDQVNEFGDVPKTAFRELESAGIAGKHSLDKNKFGLLTLELGCVITKNGDYVVGENVSGRLIRWLGEYNSRSENTT